MTRLMSPLEHAARAEACGDGHHAFFDGFASPQHYCTKCRKAWNGYWQPIGVLQSTRSTPVMQDK